MLHSFPVILVLYLPMTSLAYVIYGEDTKDNVILSLSSSPLVIISNILMVLHTIMAFLRCINPISLQTESYFNVPNGKVILLLFILNFLYVLMFRREFSLVLLNEYLRSFGNFCQLHIII